MPSANSIFLRLLGLVLLIGLAWYGYWFATNFEQQSREVRTDISPEARKNRFLAAEHFLQEVGREVQSHAGRDIFSLNPSHDDTIVLGSRSGLFLERNNEQLLEWVSAGGNLIFVPEISFYDTDNETDESLDEDMDATAEQNDGIAVEEGKKDTLLAQLGVELLFVDEEEELDFLCEDDPEFCDEEPDSVATDEQSAGEDGEKSKDTMVTVTFNTSHPGEFKARFLSDRYLLDGNELAEVSVGEPDAPNLLRYSLDNGTVTVLSDITLFTNSAIGQYDHAYLFTQLVRSPGKVWIVYSADMPSLSALLWQRAPYLVMITVIMLLMAGWRMLRSSGPQFKPQYEARRNLLEHLDATAEYSWRVDKARRLFNDNRHAIEQAWRRRHPQLNAMSTNERCEWIGAQTGMTARAVERSLYGEIDSEQDFIRATAVLQRLAGRVNHITLSASPP